MMETESSRFHLDGLVDAELEGRLDAAGQARLAEHRASCVVCSLESVFRSGEDEVSEQELDRFFGAFELPNQSAPVRSRRRLWIAASVAAVLTTSAFAAVRVFSPAEPEPEPPEEAVAIPQVPEPAEPSSELVETPLEEPEPIEEDPVAVVDVDALFRRANEARREGRVAAAARLYRQVIQAEPRSERGLTSRVNLGRLWMRSRPRRALAQFDAYLRLQPRGSLAEEALVGRARALENLGRTREERRAWEQLLRRFPQSLHAGRARQRLTATAVE